MPARGPSTTAPPAGSVVHLLVLNAWTLVKLFWLRRRGEKVVLAGVAPGWAPLRPILERVARRLRDRGIVGHWSDGLCYDDEVVTHAWVYVYPGLFWKTEPLCESLHGFDRFDRVLDPVTAYAARHAACAHHYQTLRNVTGLRTLAERNAGHRVVAHGFAHDVLASYHAFFGGLGAVEIKAPLHPSRIANLLSGMVVLAQGLVWIARRTRVAPLRRSFDLAADFADDIRGIDLARHAVDAPERLLFILRTRGAKTQARKYDTIRKATLCVQDEGVVPLRRLPELAWTFVRDSLRLMRVSLGQPPHLCLRVQRLALSRLQIEGLLERFELRAFFSRDDYNSEHILRTDALRRRGALSLGLSHGIPTPELRNPIWRYLDYDIYYTFGRHLHETYAGERWPERMEVHGSGSFGLSWEDWCTRARARTNDIVYFGTHGLDAEKLHRWMVEVARRFPDRKVIVKHKRSRGRFYDGYAFDRSDMPENMVDSQENSYELMLRCRYSFSPCSTTTGAEGPQFGQYSFVLETPPGERGSYFADFPAICVRSPEEAIARIEAIENETETYPFDALDGMTNLSGRYIVDMMREDLGRGPLDCPEPRQ